MTAVPGSPDVIAKEASDVRVPFIVIAPNEAVTVRIAECLAPLLQPKKAPQDDKK